MTTDNPDLWPVPSPEVALLFEPVLEWLDAGAPHRDIGRHKDVAFNFSDFISSYSTIDYAHHDCGTACGIAGALIMFNWSQRTQELIYFDADEGPKTTGKELGMTDSQVWSLFFGVWGEKVDLVREWITPGMAAHAIRTFLATGYPEWVKDAAYLAREKADQ